MDLFCTNQRKKTKCRRKEEEEEEDQPRKSGVESLPHDTALDILSRLPITSLIQFRFVNRSWNALSHDPLLPELHFSRIAKTESNLILILHCDYPIRNQLYFVELSDHNQQESQIVAKKIETPFGDLIPEFNLISSCNGLLCLSDSLYFDPVYIYNPFTREYRELPRSRQFDEQEVVFGFGFHPVTNEYKVIRIVYYWNRYSETVGYYPWLRIRRYARSDVQVYSLGSTAWRSIGQIPFQMQQNSSSEVLLNGRLHWLTRARAYPGSVRANIVSFDLAEERFKQIPGPDFQRRRKREFHLAVLGGCLAAAVHHKEVFEIWVMKEYEVGESWIKEFSIGGPSCSPVKPELGRPSGIWRRISRGRVLCLMKNGNVLIEYDGGVLVSFDPENGAFERLMFEGMPEMFRTFVHLGCLNSPHAPILMNVPNK